ncbi:Quinolinate phosphoribosyl transferase [Piptocephalis cylindrospora]|uniref:Nicotinate-nucleotide pyrophosphorylase [carboxylating] n=1 Tax=Piptocephalis cylindrospora TaxID=1907219 RepID=A0A4P9Y307_9FUNG|nr:Quinolinate phosphoribosyl transferase [Piptocephalis cylindrospora]|eukprot:RKP12992.1 Quinolinate phosphoribosyl transferase [Piptocephalis cylindrospora]
MPSYQSLIPPSTLSRQVTDWLAEDIPSFDYGGQVVGDSERKAVLLAKSPGILAGVPWVNEVFRQLGCSITWNFQEGQEVGQGSQVTEVAEVRGPACRILLGERVALNVLARCSGIAARAHRLRTIAQEVGWKGRIAGTRKTTPGFRLVEKYGMLVGGCDGHRMDLSSMVMLKDNHIWSHGSITEAVRAAREVAGFSVKVEVEARSEEEAQEAAEAGADVVMLDNYTGKGFQAASAKLKALWANSPLAHVLIEASGGITEATLSEYLSPDVDVVSLGSLSQSVPHVDFSLKIRRG